MKQISITFTDYGDGRTVVDIDPPDALKKDPDTMTELELNAFKALILITTDETTTVKKLEMPSA